MRVMMRVVNKHDPIGQTQQAPTVGLGEIRCGEDFVSSTARNNTTSQQHDVIGLGCFGKVVGRHHDGATCVSLLVDDIENVLTTYEIETGNRLVEEENVASLRQTLSDKNTLTLPTGKFVKVAASEVAQLKAIYCLVDNATIIICHPTKGTASCESSHRDNFTNRDW
jgi:hypothetical protein